VQDKVDVQLGRFHAQVANGVSAHGWGLFGTKVAYVCSPVALLGQVGSDTVDAREEKFDPLVRCQGAHKCHIAAAEHKTHQRRTQGNSMLELDIEHLVSGGFIESITQVLYQRGDGGHNSTLVNRSRLYND